jgi:hypothetical protein
VGFIPCVAFAEGGDALEVCDDGQQIAEAPDAGLIDSLRGAAAFLPEPPERGRIGKIAGSDFGVGPAIEDFEQGLARGAAKVRGNVVAGDSVGAAGASKLMRWSHEHFQGK